MEDSVFEVQEKEHNFDIKGISGTVTKFAYKEYEFPCIKIVITNENTPAKCDAMLLQNMLIKSKSVDNLDLANTVVLKTITVYIGTEDSTKKIGRIYPAQLGTILDIFEKQEIVAYTEQQEKLEGMYVHALCG